MGTSADDLFRRAFLRSCGRGRRSAALIGKRVRADTARARAGGASVPFHNEKSPSFTVNEEKQFFHCFGCGAHGDAIGFVMRVENATFLEACEQLAGAAGLTLPKPSVEARAAAERQATVIGALEAACRFFQDTLRASEGKAGLAYLEGRGLDAETIARFRLGYAPTGRARLLQSLGREFPEPLLVEAGLVRRNESGEPYDYFRDRVIFPIADRAGRVIAFGGRTMGDAQPKYLNSPDTPVFEKGHVLYSYHLARGARLAGGADSPSNTAVVVEGYMDVIALHAAGFAGAVAPLGTALTEPQLELLWRLTPEPVLCFDGDAAGQRAAGRAIDRALPLLRPDRSLRIACLPSGCDPDSLIRSDGPAAMEAVLGQALPLVEALWRRELIAKPLVTPEQRADFSGRLDRAAARIADKAVAREYQQELRDRRYRHFRSSQEAKPGMGRGFGRPDRGSASRTKAGRFGKADAPSFPRVMPGRAEARRQEELLLATVLCHPRLLGELVEDLAALVLESADLDALRNCLIDCHARSENLDADALQLHLSKTEHRALVATLLDSRLADHAAFLQPGTDLVSAREGWLHTLSLREKRRLEAEARAAGRDLGPAVTDAELERVVRLSQQSERYTILMGDD